MQQTLTTWDKYRKMFEKNKNPPKGFIVILFLVFALTLFLILFTGKSNSDIWIKERNIYLVCYGENLDSKSAEVKQKEIVSSGGAGNIIGQEPGDFSCVIFAYNNQNDAEKIKLANQIKFDNLHIKCLKLNKIDQKMQNKIKIEYDKERICYLYSLLDCVPNIIFDYEKGLLSKTEILKNVLEINKQICNLEDVGDDKSSLSRDVNFAYLRLRSHLENFVSDFTEKGETLSLKKFYIDLIFELENINKILTES